MKKATTDSFILELKLNTTECDDRILAQRFFVAFLIKNRLIRHAKKALSSMRMDKTYRSCLKEYISLKDNDDPISKACKRDLSVQLSMIRQSYGLSEYQFHGWIKVQQQRYSKYIDSNTAQKLATIVWKSVEDVIFRKGKTIHFKRLDALTALEGKNNSAGLRFRDGTLYWLGLSMQAQVRKDDVYAKEALTHKVKYCRIARRAMGTTYHYYVQLILEGLPPQKHKFIDGKVGIDPGVSSEAVFSETGCILSEIAPDREDIQKQVRVLSRKMDRSRRATNPDNYNPDGTVKKGRKKWVKSKTYKQTQMRLKTLRRRNADTVRQAEEMFANNILCNHGTDIVTEKMSYQALQRRAKEDKTTKEGKHKSKKRFGTSIAKHAPARFLAITERKLNYINKSVNYVDTWKFKASQYDHVLGDYKKPSRSQRSKIVGGHKVQRDLYSAFLLWSAKNETEVDRNLCFEMFPLFLSYQGACISKLLSSDRKYPSSFGLKDFM